MPQPLAPPLPASQDQLIEELKSRLLCFQEEIDFLNFQWAKYKIERKELRRLPKKVKGIEQDRRNMYSLAKQVMCCRKPSPSYPIFMYEQFYLFHLRAIKSDKPYQIIDPKSFLKAYFSSDSADQHLLCELYLHEYICIVDRKFNMSPYVGDIQLHAFASFAQNQIRWELAYSTVEHNEKNVSLWVRGELKPPHDIRMQQVSLLESPTVVHVIKNFQDEVITTCLHTIRSNQTNDVMVCKL